jgi:hypothetical protein
MCCAKLQVDKRPKPPLQLPPPCVHTHRFEGKSVTYRSLDGAADTSGELGNRCHWLEDIRRFPFVNPQTGPFFKLSVVRERSAKTRVDIST